MAAVKHVVVDSGGFIRNASLKDIGENIYTLQEVLSEIRDKATRQRLQVLPYELKLKDPSPDTIRTVTEFSKKTGDYKSLSAVDIRVLALVYQLEKEHVGTKHLKDTPNRNVSWQTAKKALENPTEIAGFYLNKGDKDKETKLESARCTEQDEHIREGVGDLQMTRTIHTETGTDHKVSTLDKPQRETVLTWEQNVTESDTEKGGTGSEFVAQDNKDRSLNDKNESCKSSPLTDLKDEGSESRGDTRETPTGDLVDSTHKDGETVEIDEGGKMTGVGEGDILPSMCLENDSSEDEADSSNGQDDEDDDGGGWITPGNIKQVKASMGDINTQKAEVVVGCITTDFSMQNILLQMGLNVISVDGMLIKRAKTYVLRCFACFKISTDMTREFCFHCGNQTLQKVSMTVEEDGNIRYFLSTRKPQTTRGMKYSLPTPKGGKHAQNPVLVEDQKEAQQRGSKNSRVKYNVFDPDYVAHTSPFAPTDIYSRAAQLGIRGQRRQKKKQNPNENKKVYGRRK